MNLTKKEFVDLFRKKNFLIKNIYPVENMPFLYKFRFFREKNQKEFNENRARRDGYQFSFFGKIIQYLLIKFFPDQFCNIYVLIAKKM
jgi:hypothetical protein